MFVRGPEEKCGQVTRYGAAPGPYQKTFVGCLGVVFGAGMSMSLYDRGETHLFRGLPFAPRTIWDNKVDRAVVHTSPEFCWNRVSGDMREDFLRSLQNMATMRIPEREYLNMSTSTPARSFAFLSGFPLMREYRRPNSLTTLCLRRGRIVNSSNSLKNSCHMLCSICRSVVSAC